MKILIATLGSVGDVLPFVALGKEIQRRGHDVRLYSNPAFERFARESNLPFVPVGSVDKIDTFLHSSNSTDPIKGMKMVAEGTVNSIPAFYDAMEKDIASGQTMVIGSSFAFAARVLGEKHGLPTAVVHLAPSWFRSEFMAPRFSPIGHMKNAPRFLKRMIWKGMDKRFLDPIYAEPFNRYRAQLGLNPISRLMHDWIHDADICIGMFPEWFAERQADWPSNFHATGFPLYDHGNAKQLPEEVTAFLEAGPAPVAFTAGTANASSHRFFATSAEACKIAGRRGMLITQHPEQLPSSLPEGVAHFSYIPFKALLPRLAAFVHHGGIGSTSQAMLAGVPQLIRPMAYDQFDNASRAARLGIAKEILPRQYKPQTVARLIQRLPDSQEIKARCADVARKTQVVEGVSLTCNILLEKLGEASPLAA